MTFYVASWLDFACFLLFVSIISPWWFLKVIHFMGFDVRLRRVLVKPARYSLWIEIAATVYYISDISEKTKLLAMWFLLLIVNYRDDDNDYWKKKKALIYGKIKDIGGRLVVVPRPV